MLELEPIGIFHCKEKYPYDVPRQGVLAGANRGEIELFPGRNLEQALLGLEGFSRIWVLFHFSQAEGWRPMVLPPRHTEHKQGVFATRSPYRPNHIGMSCVKLLGIEGLRIIVEGHDLLEGTPVLDIKPYLPYADAFPDAKAGWTEQTEAKYAVSFSENAAAQLDWLENNGVPCIKAFILDRLENDPLNPRRNRMCGDLLAYRTWRVRFDVTEGRVLVQEILSGYTQEELRDTADKYGDKQVHRTFLEKQWHL